MFPAGVVAGGPDVSPDGFEDELPGVLPAGVVAGGPGVWPDGVVAGFPPLSVDDVPSEEVPVLVPGLGIDAQNAWTDVKPFAVAAAANREKATDDNALPLVALADTCEYAVHKPNSLAVVVGAANAVLRP